MQLSIKYYFNVFLIKHKIELYKKKNMHQNIACSVYLNLPGLHNRRNNKFSKGIIEFCRESYIRTFNSRINCLLSVV